MSKVFATIEDIKTAHELYNSINLSQIIPETNIRKDKVKLQINKLKNSLGWVRLFFNTKKNKSRWLLNLLHQYGFNFSVNNVEDLERIKYFETNISIGAYYLPPTQYFEFSKYQYEYRIIDSTQEIIKMYDSNIVCPLIIQIKNFLDQRHGIFLSEVPFLQLQARLYGFKIVGYVIDLVNDENDHLYQQQLNNVQMMIEQYPMENLPVLLFRGTLHSESNLEQILGWTHELIDKYQIILEIDNYITDVCYQRNIQVIDIKQSTVFVDQSYKIDHLSHYIENGKIHRIENYVSSEICDIQSETVYPFRLPSNMLVGDFICYCPK